MTKEKLNSWYNDRFATTKEYDCELCKDTGEVDCIEAVYSGESHMAMIGSQKCECEFNNEIDMSGASDGDR